VESEFLKPKPGLQEQSQAEVKHADIIVVGGGPAGAAAAYDLAMAGCEVLVLDKADFPRFKACAGGLTIKALARLRYSVAPVVKATSDIMETSLNLHRKTIFHAPGTICALTVRTELDDFCLQKTLAAGASFQKISPIRSIERDTNKLVLKTCDETFSCNYLIGADGAHSVVRKLATDFKPGRMAIALEGIVPSERIGKHVDVNFTFDFGVVKQGYGWLFPKGDHINVGIYIRRPEEVKISKQQLFDYVSRRLGVSEIDHIAGFPIGIGGEKWQANDNRILLVGDAAGYAEALLGEGLHNAIKSGQIAAQSILAKNANGSEDLLRLYAPIIAQIQEDLANSRMLSEAFYRFLPISFGLLKHAVKGPFLKGYANGQTLTEYTRSRFSFQPEPHFERSLTLKGLDERF
jgi:geranylgeranyl reductase family protein